MTVSCNGGARQRQASGGNVEQQWTTAVAGRGHGGNDRGTAIAAAEDDALSYVCRRRTGMATGGTRKAVQCK